MRISIVGTGYVGLVTRRLPRREGARRRLRRHRPRQGRLDQPRRAADPRGRAGRAAAKARGQVARRDDATWSRRCSDSDITFIAAGTPFDGQEIDLQFVRQIADADRRGAEEEARLPRRRRQEHRRPRHDRRRRPPAARAGVRQAGRRGLRRRHEPGVPLRGRRRRRLHAARPHRARRHRRADAGRAGRGLRQLRRRRPAPPHEQRDGGDDQVRLQRASGDDDLVRQRDREPLRDGRRHRRGGRHGRACT